MGSCLDIQNSDCTEIRGCTAFSFTKNDQVFHGRDNDLPPFLRKISKVSNQKIYRAEGNPSRAQFKADLRFLRNNTSYLH
jgi:hypothetical protein